MRTLILLAASAALAACGGNKDAEGNAAQAGDDLTANAIVANDTTAIDAATGDAANMAEDVEYTFNDADENAGGNAVRNGGDDDEDEDKNADSPQGNAL